MEENLYGTTKINCAHINVKLIISTVARARTRCVKLPAASNNLCVQLSVLFIYLACVYNLYICIAIRKHQRARMNV